MNYVYNIDDDKVFGVYSNMDNIDYIIALDNPITYNLLEVMKIVDKEIEKYVTLSEGDDEYEYYYQVGYIECVRRALRDRGIKAEFYDKV